MERRFILVFAFLMVGALGFTFYLESQNYFIGDVTSFTDTISNPNPVNGTPQVKTVRNEEYGFEFEYPVSFFDAGHEPQILVGECNGSAFPKTCPDISSIATDNSDNFKTANIQKWSVNNTQFCLYQTSSASVGNQYYYDYYATVKNDKCLVVELQSSTYTCENYLPLEQGNVEQEANYNRCVSKREMRKDTLQDIVLTFTLVK